MGPRHVGSLLGYLHKSRTYKAPSQQKGTPERNPSSAINLSTSIWVLGPKEASSEDSYRWACLCAGLQSDTWSNNSQAETNNSQAEKLIQKMSPESVISLRYLAEASLQWFSPTSQFSNMSPTDNGLFEINSRRK